jgi:chromosome segregation ATPase
MNNNANKTRSTATTVAIGKKSTSTAAVQSSTTNMTSSSSLSASALKLQLDEQQSQLASLRAHCRTLETQLDAKHSALMALEQNNHQQHHQQQQGKDKDLNNKSTNTNAADAHEREVVQLARQVVAERGTLTKMKAEKARIAGEIADKSNELASQKKQIAKLKATNDALELKCVQIENQMV